MQEKNGGTVTANLLTGLGIDEFFTRTDGVGVRRLLPNALGSTVALGDGTGTLQTQYTYEPFGVTTQTGSASNNSYKYTGREDDGTGLSNYRARYYSPRMGRFVSEDPIEFLGGDVNLYAYVRNNPTRWKDPSGLFLGSADGYLTYPSDVIGGLGDLARGRSNMMDAGTTGADAYFHCRANCQASRRGVGGYHAAVFASWLREVYQNDPAAARASDEAANAQGQGAGRCGPDTDCYKACANLIPPWGIPQRHLPPHADPIHIYQR